ncbi:MAG: ADP-ribosylglycohydrolase family protein [Flammeovirgaceae bacterium]
MREYGTHYHPAGTWSDESSLAFCLAESLCNGYNLNDIAQNFVKWQDQAFWTPHRQMFDIGITTSKAIRRLKNNTSPLYSGGSDELDNGNGSLMRIIPLIFYLKYLDIAQRFQTVKEVSGITHSHIRSIISCFIYTEYALLLLNSKSKWDSFVEMQKTVNLYLKEKNVNINEISKFQRILETSPKKFYLIPEEKIYSSGYVLHTLEASFWCFLNSNVYSEAVLKAVNLGEDTDTMACITGGLAGLYYGIQQIPEEWTNVLARKADIESLANKLAQKYCR